MSNGSGSLSLTSSSTYSRFSTSHIGMLATCSFLPRRIAFDDAVQPWSTEKEKEGKDQEEQTERTRVKIGVRSSLVEVRKEWEDRRGTVLAFSSSEAPMPPPADLGCRLLSCSVKRSASRRRKPMPALACRPKAEGVSWGRVSSMYSIVCSEEGHGSDQVSW